MRNRSAPRRSPASPLAASDSAGTASPFTLALAAAVAAIAFLVFLPAVNHDFVGWDDDVLLLTNPDFRGLGLYELRWMFTTMRQGHYQPLTWLSFAANYLADGLRPYGYHLVNNVLHAINAALVFVLALRVFDLALPGVTSARRRAAAFLSALLFALHPLRVESVAWVTERRDVLSACFLLASVLAYFAYAAASPPRRGRYCASVALLVLSLLSKAWGMTLPVVLLILDVYPLRRLRQRSDIRPRLLEKIPFLLLAAAAAAIAALAQSRATPTTVDSGVAYRLAQSFYGICFYPLKTLLPFGLAPIYEHPASLAPLSLRYLIPTAAVVFVTFLLWIARRRWPAGLAAWAVYLVVVSPVLGVIQAGPQFVACRYSYISCIPFAMLVGALPVVGWGRSAAWLRPPLVVGICIIVPAVIILLSAETLRQIRAWRDTEALFTTALEHDPNSWNAHTVLGEVMFQRANYAAALKHLETAFANAPKQASVAVNLASCLGQLGRSDESADLFRRAAAMPGIAATDRVRAANGLVALGRDADARPLYERILADDTDNIEAHFGLAHLLRDTGEARAAVPHFIRVVELGEPSVASGRSNASEFAIAAVFAESCTALTEILAQSGDQAGAETYRRKRSLVAMP